MVCLLVLSMLAISAMGLCACSYIKVASSVADTQTHFRHLDVLLTQQILYVLLLRQQLLTEFCDNSVFVFQIKHLLLYERT